MKSQTGKILLVAIAAGALGLIAALALDGPGPLLKTEAPPAGVTVAERGAPVPPISLPGLDGKSVAVPAAYAGRPLLINVWASWCGPCIKEMPELQRYSAEQGGKGVQVVGIALDDEAAVRAFLKTTPVSYPILIDAAGPADAGVRLGNPKGVLPYSVLISADGRLLKQRIGPFEHGEIDGWAKP